MDQQGQRHTRQPHHHEGRPPVEGFVQPAPGQGTDSRTDRDAEGVDREGRRPTLGGEIIGDQGVGGRTATRLANAHPDAGHGQMDEIARQARQRGHRTPDQDRQGDDPGSSSAIRPARNRNAEHGIEGREGNSRKKAQGCIGYLELLLDRLEKNRENRAIDEVEDVDDHEQTQRVPRHRVRDGLSIVGIGDGVTLREHLRTLSLIRAPARVNEYLVQRNSGGAEVLWQSAALWASLERLGECATHEGQSIRSGFP